MASSPRQWIFYRCVQWEKLQAALRGCEVVQAIIENFQVALRGCKAVQAIIRCALSMCALCTFKVCTVPFSGFPLGFTDSSWFV